MLGTLHCALAGTATDVTGLFYTGNNAGGGLAAGGATDAYWTVAYARVEGQDNTYNGVNYTGAAYVLSSSYIDSAYVANTSNAQWITAPGASTASSGGTSNIGGDYLPGNGSSGTNTAYYVYELQFTITGTGSGNVSNDVQISMTIAADDDYAVYVNPSSAPHWSNGGGGHVSFGRNSSAVASGTGAWDNTTSFQIGNKTQNPGDVNNATFVIGTNTIYVLVQNTNSVENGSSNSTALNPSGLLVYQLGSGITIDGDPIQGQYPVPEAATWLQTSGLMGLGMLWWWFRRRASRSVA